MACLLLVWDQEKPTVGAAPATFSAMVGVAPEEKFAALVVYWSPFFPLQRCTEKLFCKVEDDGNVRRKLPRFPNWTPSGLALSLGIKRRFLLALVFYSGTSMHVL